MYAIQYLQRLPKSVKSQVKTSKIEYESEMKFGVKTSSDM